MRRLLFLCIMFLVYSGSTPAFAVPSIWTFDGEITDGAQWGLEAGTTVKIRWNVDLDTLINTYLQVSIQDINVGGSPVSTDGSGTWYANGQCDASGIKFETMGDILFVLTLVGVQDPANIVPGRSTANGFLETYGFTIRYSSVLTSVEPVDVAPVPEPATMVLFGIGIVGLAGIGRKKMKKA